MKKTLIKLLPVLLILIVIGVAFVPHQANASFFDFITCAVSENCTSISGNWVMSFFAEIGNVVMSVFGYFLSAMGVLLNISILLTLNIKALYEATPAIEQIWIVIRNISSLFIIFGLIFTSIMTILDISKSSVKELVGKIILAGLFINFSLFFTKVAIDTSNLVSMQFYRAIAPTSVNISFTKDSIGTILSGALTDGGLSNIFMESLKISTIYGQKNAITKDNNQNLFTIIIATSAGSMLMLLAALSFFAASIAFLLRLVILLLLMGFSPVFFVGMVFPNIQKEISGKWLDWLTKELLFMPIYLLFMYVALRFLSGQDGTGFLQTLNGSNPNTAGVLGFVGLLIQYTIAFVLINIPLLAAVKVGGVGAAWGDNAKKWAGGMLGQHTLGRGAKAASGWLAQSGIAARNPNMAILANKALGGISGAAYGGSKGGYDKRFKDYSKSRTDFAKNIKTPGAVAANYVNSEMARWDSRVIGEKASLGLRLSEIKKQKALYTDMLRSGNPVQEDLALKKLKELEAEENSIKGTIGKDTSEAREREEARVKKASEQLRQREFAENLESGMNLGTSKANKEAAEAIRKELDKGKEKKALDAIKDLFKEDKSDDGKEDKSKGGGKGKDKDE